MAYIAGQIQKFAEQGFQLNRDGTLSPIAGGPHDPRVVAGKSRGKALMHLDAQGNTVNDSGVVPSVADKAGATKGAEASAELPSAVTKAQAEAWIKAGFELKPGFDPKTGLPGYVNGRGQFLRLSDDAAQEARRWCPKTPI